MPEWLPQALAGLALGGAVSLFNHYILLAAIAESRKKEAHKAKNAVLKGYVLRYVLNIAVLFLARKNTVMLIAAAIGLVSGKNMLVIKHILGNPEKKGRG